MSLLLSLQLEHHRVELVDVEVELLVVVDDDVVPVKGVVVEELVDVGVELLVLVDEDVVPVNGVLVELLVLLELLVMVGLAGHPLLSASGMQDEDSSNCGRGKVPNSCACWIVTSVRVAVVHWLNVSGITIMPGFTC